MDSLKLEVHMKFDLGFENKDFLAFSLHRHWVKLLKVLKMKREITKGTKNETYS